MDQDHINVAPVFKRTRIKLQCTSEKLQNKHGVIFTLSENYSSAELKGKNITLHITDSGSIQSSHCLKSKRNWLVILFIFLVNWLSKSSILLLIWPHSCDGGDNKHIEIIKHTLME